VRMGVNVVLARIGDNSDLSLLSPIHIPNPCRVISP
jgi:hypothetical protein